MLSALAALLLTITTYTAPLNLEVRPERSASPVLTHGSESYADSQWYDSQVLPVPGDNTILYHVMSAMDSPVATGTQTTVLATFPKSDPTDQTIIGQILTPSEGYENGHTRHGNLVHRPDLSSDTYYLYYTTGQGDTICLAISTSGADGPYTKHEDNPIVTSDNGGRDDGTHVSDPEVFLVGSTWYMYYSYRGAAVLPGIRYATSTDGIEWTKGGSGDIFTAPSGFFVEKHETFFINGTYVMFHDSGNTSNPYREYVATSGSPTGPYTRVNLSPFLAETGTATWDKWHVCCFGVFYNDVLGNYQAFYCGTDSDSSGGGQPYSNCEWDVGLLTWKSRASGGSGRGQGGRRNAFHIPGSLERDREWALTKYGQFAVWGIAP